MGPFGTNPVHIDSEGRHIEPGGDVSSDELLERLERLAQRYEANHLSDHARGVHHAARLVRAYFAPVELRRSVGGETAEETK